jgi:arylsulfatase A-like enzyme
MDSVSNRRELPRSWDELVFDAGKWKTGWNAFFGYADGSDRNHRNGMVMPFEAADVPDEGYPDGLTSSLAVEKIKQLAKKGQPFFLGVGFFKPHLPFNAPKKYWDLYHPDDLPAAPFADLPIGVSLASLQPSGEFNGYKAGSEKASLQKSVRPDYARQLRHGYMASVSYVDAQIGKLMEALRFTGLDKQTIVVLWGDHGWHLGDHRVWGKHTLSEWSLQSPLILSVPGIEKTGSRDMVVSSTDIYPTLMELCGLPKPDSLDGRSLLAVLTGREKQHANRPSFGYFNKGVTMRTDRYRVTRYDREQLPLVEVYDHRKDPFEHTNIAEKYPRLTRRLLHQLDRQPNGLSYPIHSRKP